MLPGSKKYIDLWQGDVGEISNGEISYGDIIWWEIKWWEIITIWLSNGETDGDKESDGDDEIKWWDEIQTVTWNSNGENLSQMVIFQK